MTTARASTSMKNMIDLLLGAGFDRGCEGGYRGNFSRKMITARNYSAHPVHDHSPVLDSGFRRNDVSYHAIFKSVIPAKAGIQVFFWIC
jgi:hypothetical protein